MGTEEVESERVTSNVQIAFSRSLCNQFCLVDEKSREKKGRGDLSRLIVGKVPVDFICGNLKNAYVEKNRVQNPIEFEQLVKCTRGCK